jgi:hypothetical protein
MKYRWILSLIASLGMLACDRGAQEPSIPDGGPPATTSDAGPAPTPPPLPCGPRDPRPHCADAEPLECEPGSILPGRIIEVRLPAYRDLGPTHLGFPLQADFSPIRFGSRSIFVDGGDVIREVTNEVRADVIDFESERGRRAHASACARAGGSAALGGCVSLEGSSSRELRYQALHVLDSREYFFVDDLSSAIDWDAVPDEALWYVHSIETGYAIDMLATKAGGTGSFGFELSGMFGSTRASGSGTKTVVGRPAFEAAFGFRNWSSESGYALSTLLRGFVPADDRCLFSDSFTDFEACWRPAALPAPIVMTVRNVPQRCLPEDERVEREHPVEVTVRFETVEVIGSPGPDATWTLVPSCEVEDVDALSAAGRRTFVLDGISSGSYEPPPTANPVLQTGVMPGQRLRCGLNGRALAAGAAPTAVQYADFELEVPNPEGETVLEGSFEPLTPGEARYRVHYTATFSRLAE